MGPGKESLEMISAGVHALKKAKNLKLHWRMTLTKGERSILLQLTRNWNWAHLACHYSLTQPLFLCKSVWQTVMEYVPSYVTVLCTDGQAKNRSQPVTRRKETSIQITIMSGRIIQVNVTAEIQSQCSWGIKRREITENWEGQDEVRQGFKIRQPL